MIEALFWLLLCASGAVSALALAFIAMDLWSGMSRDVLKILAWFAAAIAFWAVVQALGFH